MSKLEQFIKTFPWVHNENIPFTKLKKDLSACKIGLISTGGLYVKTDTPFAIVGRDDVDESYREIPLQTDIGHLRIAHEHFNKAFADKDINVIFPILRLMELVEEGFIGSLADINYSISGYIPKPERLYASGEAISDALVAQGVDVALLVPV